MKWIGVLITIALAPSAFAQELSPGDYVHSINAFTYPVSGQKIDSTDILKIVSIFDGGCKKDCQQVFFEIADGSNPSKNLYSLVQAPEKPFLVPILPENLYRPLETLYDPEKDFYSDRAEYIKVESGGDPKVVFTSLDEAYQNRVKPWESYDRSNLKSLETGKMYRIGVRDNRILDDGIDRAEKEGELLKWGFVPIEIEGQPEAWVKVMNAPTSQVKLYGRKSIAKTSPTLRSLAETAVTDKITAPEASVQISDSLAVGPLEPSAIDGRMAQVMEFSRKIENLRSKLLTQIFNLDKTEVPDSELSSQDFETFQSQYNSGQGVRPALRSKVSAALLKVLSNGQFSEEELDSIALAFTSIGEAGVVRSTKSKRAQRDEIFNPQLLREKLAVMTVMAGRKAIARTFTGFEDYRLIDVALSNKQFSMYNANDANWIKALLGPTRVPQNVESETAFYRSYAASVLFLNSEYSIKTSYKLDKEFKPNSKDSDADLIQAEISHYHAPNVNPPWARKKNAHRLAADEFQICLPADIVGEASSASPVCASPENQYFYSIPIDARENDQADAAVYRNCAKAFKATEAEGLVVPTTPEDADACKLGAPTASASQGSQVQIKVKPEGRLPRGGRPGRTKYF